MPHDKVLIIVGDATENVDTLYPYYRLQEAGMTPVVAGPEKRTFQMVLHEIRPGWTITREWEGYQITATISVRGSRCRSTMLRPAVRALPPKSRHCRIER